MRRGEREREGEREGQGSLRDLLNFFGEGERGRERERMSISTNANGSSIINEVFSYYIVFEKVISAK